MSNESVEQCNRYVIAHHCGLTTTYFNGPSPSGIPSWVAHERDAMIFDSIDNAQKKAAYLRGRLGFGEFDLSVCIKEFQEPPPPKEYVWGLEVAGNVAWCYSCIGDGVMRPIFDQRAFASVYRDLEELECRIKSFAGRLCWSHETLLSHIRVEEKDKPGVRVMLSSQKRMSENDNLGWGLSAVLDDGKSVDIGSLIRQRDGTFKIGSTTVGREMLLASEDDVDWVSDNMIRTYGTRKITKASRHRTVHDLHLSFAVHITYGDGSGGWIGEFDKDGRPWSDDDYTTTRHKHDAMKFESNGAAIRHIRRLPTSSFGGARLLYTIHLV